MWKLWSVAASLAILTACGEGDPVAGQHIYSITCVTCHGPDGTLGLDQNGRPAANLNERVPQLTDDEIATRITDGFGNMKPVNLSNKDVKDVVAYVRQEFGDGLTDSDTQ
jgi:mono/diheme cytochrome c family protein